MVYSTLFPRKDNNHQLTHGICTAWSAPTISKTKNLMLRYLSYKARKKNMKIIIINDQSLMLMWENETTTTAPLKKTTTTKTRKKRRKSRGDHRVCLRDRKITN